MFIQVEIYIFKQLKLCFKNLSKTYKSIRKALKKFRKIPSKCFRNFKQFNRIKAQILWGNFFYKNINI